MFEEGFWTHPLVETAGYFSVGAVVGTERVEVEVEDPADAPMREAALDRALRGEVVLPGAPGYEEARTIWNAMIDRRPGLILQCADTDDIVAAVMRLL